jgi:hypothetical protein
LIYFSEKALKIIKKIYIESFKLFQKFNKILTIFKLKTFSLKAYLINKSSRKDLKAQKFIFNENKAFKKLKAFRQQTT